MKLKKIMHVSKSPVAGSAGNLNACLNKYSYYSSNVSCKRTVISAGNFMSDYPDNISTMDTSKYMDEADIIHYHNCSPKEIEHNWKRNKPFLIQLHSEPKIKEQVWQKFKKHCITIAQKHVTLYDEFIYSVPNIFDIYEDRYRPKKKHEDKVVIFYSATSTASYPDYSNTCCGKGYARTIEILKKIKSKYKDKVEIRIYTKERKDIVLAAKQDADIVIDECVTGGYHLTSLEGLSAGCVVINGLNERVESVFREKSGLNNRHSLPFEIASIKTLYEKLEYLIDLKLHDLQRFQHMQYLARDFMIKYWHPAKMVKYYEEFYDKILGFTSDPYIGLKYSGNLQRVRTDRLEVKKQYQKDIFDISNFISGKNFRLMQDSFKDKSILLLCLGPSVNKIDIDSILKKYDCVFSCNFFYKRFPNLDVDFWACIDAIAFRDAIEEIYEDTTVISNYGTCQISFANKRIWLTDNLEKLNSEFKSGIEFERPFTVATIMLAMSIYMGFSDIGIIGVDLSLAKKKVNYCYEDRRYNIKFRDFSFNYRFIIKEFKKLKHEAELRNINVYNLDPDPDNFDVFPKKVFK